MNKFRYSEIFGDTIQGEGMYTGVPTVWIRFWGCNFECNGFGQKSSDPSKWELPYKDLNVEDYTSMDELPVFHTGCDSSYSWAKRFGRLAHQSTASEICDKFIDLLKNEHNPNGLFVHPVSKQDTHLAFTGGEPMLNQTGMSQIMYELSERENCPVHVTVETNGTQYPRENLCRMIDDFHITSEYGGLVNDGLGDPEWFWSVSPKLSASGENWSDAIQPDVVRDYKYLSNFGQIKYVVDGSQQCWDEVERATELYRKAGIEWNVYVMPVGADREMQEEHQARITEDAVKRGYRVAARVHTWIFGNVVGK